MSADREPADPAALAALAGHPDAALTLVTQGGSADLWRLTPPGHTSFAPVVLKCPRGLSTKIRAERDALELLNSLRFPRVPTLLAADRDAGGLVLSWLHPGCVPLEQWLMAQPSSEDIARVAHALGRWCAQLHELRVPPGPIKLAADPLPWAERLVVMAQEALHALHKRARRARGALDADVALCELHLSRLQTALDEANHDPDDPLCARPGRFIHRDLRPPNILVAPDDERGELTFCGVVDFERAGAGDPAWDVVKLDWWCFEPHPALREPFWQGYGALRPAPSAQRVDLYKRFEALGLLAAFAGRHATYPDEARARLRALST